MQHRDYTIIIKILDEIEIGTKIIQEIDIKAFLENELVKRAVTMTVINIGELVKNITDETRKNILKFHGRQLQACEI